MIFPWLFHTHSPNPRIPNKGTKSPKIHFFQGVMQTFFLQINSLHNVNKSRTPREKCVDFGSFFSPSKFFIFTLCPLVSGPIGTSPSSVKEESVRPYRLTHISTNSPKIHFFQGKMQKLAWKSQQFGLENVKHSVGKFWLAWENCWLAWENSVPRGKILILGEFLRWKYRFCRVEWM